MSYYEFKPHPALSSCIDAYWTVRGDDSGTVTQRIYPDGCIDIIINLGEDFSTDSGRFTMEHGMSYLVGTMTRYKDTIRQPGTFLLGIRFKPLGFSSFFRFHSLHEITEQTIAFKQKNFPEIHGYDNDTVSSLDKFFCNQLSGHTQRLLPVISDMKSSNGIMSVSDLARRHFLTARQLERGFRQHLGISPKEYSSFLRYQHAERQIRKNTGRKSLLEIALETGYYDHAHLSNEFKKYSGFPPSQL